MPRELTHDEHAVVAREQVRRRGLADCIHYAPDWQRRSDALTAAANAIDSDQRQRDPEGVPWWRGCVVGLLPDGRMVVTGDIVSVVEVPW